jgi:flagellar basal body-associated protein FliL
VTPPQRQKKSKRGLTVLTSIVVVLAVIIAGAGTLFALHLRSTAQTKNTPKAQVTSTANGSTPISTLPGSGTTGSLNQPLQAGDNWVVTVTHIATTTASDFPPSTGHTYLEITLTLKNASATPQIVASLLQFTLADANGGKYNEAAAITKDTNIHQTPDGTVKAGQTLSAQLSYMVPQSQHTFVLSFAYNLIDGGSSSVTWSLSV